MIVLSGKITHLQSGHTSSNAELSFRIDNHPVIFKSHSMAGISEGDSVTAAGIEKNGELKALAIRNESTSVIYTPSSGKTLVIAGVVLFLISLPMMLILIGFLTAPVGLYIASIGKKIQKAEALV